MPRFIAAVRTIDGTDRVPCDAATIDEHGYLRLDTLTETASGRPGEIAGACFAPSAWLSYTLQAPPENKPDQPKAKPSTGIVWALDYPGAEAIRECLASELRRLGLD